jgi:DNA-binding MarR family transcriptional regulator
MQKKAAWPVIPNELTRITKFISKQSEESLAAQNFGITVGHFHILRRIRHGTDSVSKLADDGHTSRPAISRSVDVLVNKGLVIRTQNPTDRRNVQLSLTDEGQSLMEVLSDNTRQWMAEKLAVLSEDELEAILVAGDALKRAFTE